MRIQLGHPIGERCVNPEPAAADSFTLIDVDGIHEVAVDFCGCESVQPHVVQLLRMRWWPATVTSPKTAATFRLLEWFHILGNQSKVSAYEYYMSLVRRTDNVASSAKVRMKFTVPYHTANFLSGPLFRLPSNCPPVGSHQAPQALWSRSRFKWPRRYSTRRGCGYLPGLSSSGKESSGALE